MPQRELKIIVSNIGTTPGFNSILNPNSCPSTATVQVGLNEGHRLSSFAYMSLVRERIRHELPAAQRLFPNRRPGGCHSQPGHPGAAGHPGQQHGPEGAHDIASQIARQVRALPGVSDVLIPQDVDYPALKIDIDRERASELGLSAQEVTDSLITALTSNGMIAPSYWIDPKNGNNYLLTVQYPEGYVKNLADLGSMPLRAAHLKHPTRLESVVRISRVAVAHRGGPLPDPARHGCLCGALGRGLEQAVCWRREDLWRKRSCRQNTVINVRGTVQAMRSSFRSFGLGLILSTLLVYLILVAQLKSFVDPFLILLAVPTGLTGVLLILFATGTTMNIMSLMGVVMMVGIVVSNSILIVDFTNRLRAEGRPLRQAVSQACRIRLASRADDLAGHADRVVADGAEAGHRQRGLRAAGARDHRRAGGVGGADGVYRAGGVLHGLSPAGGSPLAPTAQPRWPAERPNQQHDKAVYDQSISVYLTLARSCLALRSPLPARRTLRSLLCKRRTRPRFAAIRQSASLI